MEVSVLCCSGTRHINIVFLIHCTVVFTHKIKTTCTGLVIFVTKVTVHVANDSPHCEWYVLSMYDSTLT